MTLLLTGLTGVNQHRREQRGDPLLNSPAEQDVIACYRRMNGDDRALLRNLLRRLGEERDEKGSA